VSHRVACVSAVCALLSFGYACSGSDCSRACEQEFHDCMDEAMGEGDRTECRGEKEQCTWICLFRENGTRDAEAGR
jgi:hypothetical protein